jgi:hypothetical protein
MNYQLGFWIVTAISGGFAVAQLFKFLPSKSAEAINRLLEFDQANADQADLKRIANSLEFFASQFPADRAPYFERLLITFQEWTRR